ncbi:hypothetical protein BM86_01465 [Bacillus thuringiensis]|uniref:Hemolysin BL lytic component L1 n=1 Tax=Bacillus thuringiensis TaxID=1428 RepID=A0A9W3SHQ3_BACTU|nr:HBL/NHE enterotoxin family protein [Bacillus thuringiensis]ANS51785.1 hemolysin BL lytic component L1 [Bacillus thuringiensis]MBH0334233.1 hypothetical protein [Bacillus thuringiensis]
MKKYPYRVLTMASLLVVTTVNVTPTIQALAQEQQGIQIDYKQGQLNLKQEDQTNFEESLKELGTNYATMQTYAQAITSAADVNLKDVDFGSDRLLKKSLPAHQQTAKTHAKEWIQNLAPKMLAVNEGIIQYDNQFQIYSDELVTSIDAKDKEQIKALLKSLVTQAKDQKKDVNDIINKLHTFDMNLSKDTQNFEEASNQFITMLDGNGELLKKLAQEIENCQNTINTQLNVFIGSAIGMGFGVGAGGLAIGLAVYSGGVLIPVILGVGAVATLVSAGYVTATSYGALNHATEGLIKLTRQQSTAKTAVSTLTLAQSSVGMFLANLQQARTALGNISTQWSTTELKYESLLKNIDAMAPEKLNLIKLDVKIAQQSWKNLKKWAETVQIDLAGIQEVPKK